MYYPEGPTVNAEVAMGERHDRDRGHGGLPGVGRRIEGVMVQEHVPFLDELLASLKAGVEARAAA
jgi:hypothetical protein